MSNGDINDAQENTLRQIKTADSVLLPIPRDAFEKLYLSPKHPSVSGALRKKLGNPTPIALLGFLIASIPNACIMMGWRGAGGQGGAIIPVYIFFGGFVQLLAAIGEWIIGNTFSCALFFTYGTFWIVQGTSLMPFFATGVHYSPIGDPLEGQETPAFFASSGFYYLTLGIITFVYTICSIRTNICLLSALILLIITFGLFAGVFFQHALGANDVAARLQVVGGAFNFALCFPILWIFFAQLLEAVDFPITLPVGDLSTIIIGRSQRIRKEQSNE